MTSVRGHIVMRDGQIQGEAIGAPIRFRDTDA